MSTYFVIFGAAVRDDGTPSGTIIRRVEGALAAAQNNNTARYMPTGGPGPNGHVEAEIIKSLLLRNGVPNDMITSETMACDTLDSVIRCNTLLRTAGDAEWITPCTSPYHLPRCVFLFRALGWKVKIASMPGDFGVLPLHKLFLYILKEIVALPYDLILLVLSRNKIK